MSGRASGALGVAVATDGVRTPVSSTRIAHAVRLVLRAENVEQALISVAVTVVIALWASAVLEQRLMKFDAVHSSIRVVLARAGRALFLLVAVLISLSLLLLPKERTEPV